MEDDDDDGTVIGQIITSVKHEGYAHGSPEFERRKRQLQVAKCREMRGFTTCSECSASEHCEIYMQVKRDSSGIK